MFNCQLFSENYCGRDPAYTNLITCDILDTLNENVSGKFYENFVIQKKSLIQQRCNVKLDLNKHICPKHRLALGKLWRRSSKCMFVEHPVHSKSKGYVISLSLYKFIDKNYSGFKLGQKVCSRAQKKFTRE